MPDDAIRRPWSHSGRPVPRRVLQPLLIRELVLDEAGLVATAKVAILAASLVAGVAGYALLRSAPEANWEGRP